MRRSTRILLICAIFILPVALLVTNYSPRHGFLRLICWGQAKQAQVFPEIQKLSVPAETSPGYDGQFYAALALDPGLARKGEINAYFDAPYYRAQRIGLPALAYVLGLGQPAAILQIYALLNFVFWVILFLILRDLTGFKRKRDFLLAFAVLWSMGTYVSMSRALTDLPALTLGVTALWLMQRKHSLYAVPFALAALCKNAILFSLPSVIWPRRGNWRSSGVALLIVLLPMVAWMIYARSILSDNVEPWEYLVAPFSGYLKALWPQNGYQLKHFVLLPYLAQILYLLFIPRLSSPFWRFGCVLAVLSIFLHYPFWEVPAGYSRSLLPLTFSFNYLLYQYESKKRYVFLYLIGNISIIGPIYCLVGYMQ